MRTVTRLGHYALRVRDMDAILGFYRDALGFDEMLRLTEEDGRIWLVYLRVTDSQFLEIFPEATGEPPTREQMGVTHLCWEVDDMDAALAELEERGIPITTPVRRGRTGNLQAWITDPEGNRVELMWMDPNGMTLRAVERLRRGEGPFPPERR